MEQTIIVDKDDNIIGAKPRSERAPGDIIRVSALWVTDKKGNILLAQRSLNKQFNPGMWGPAVAGTNEPGETYVDNIVKETAEEIGVTLKKFTPVKKVFGGTAEHPHYTQWFTAVIDKNTSFKPQKEEVAELGWFSKEDVKMLLKEMPDMFVGSATDVWEDLFL